MPKPNTGAAPRKRGEPDTQSLPVNVTQPFPVVNDPFTAAIRAAVAAELAPVIAMFEEIASRRQSDVVDTSGLCQHFDFSPPTAKKLVEQGCPHFVVGEHRRFSLSAVEKWLSERGAKT